ncbi:hypothetical protein NKR23_g6795 [Pleurostoma richardsiae]|uniref:Chitin-binding type-1 domain-containing protein n=1 Tax=Pleurostoma richardsiae TaxID=41990 RepID=A0AA38VNP4_9PEZI|nr:hypothetical protein NKR23_g6795 [Pleurostoma richardsiae]
MRWIYVSLATSLGFSGAVFGNTGSLIFSNPASQHRNVSGPKVERGHPLQENGSHPLEIRRSEADLTGSLERRQSSNGRCGPDQNNQVCTGNLCCSTYGYCGEGTDYCLAIWCQADYGYCEGKAQPTTSTTSSTSSRTTSTSTSSRTTSTSTSSSAPAPSGTLQASINGMCGNTTTCAGSRFGSCCSEFFWCGSGAAYCGAGCQSDFGTCQGGGSPPPVSITTTSTTTTARTTSTTTTSARPTVSIPPGLTSSTDGSCGNGVTCLGSRFGPCCSQFGYCGDGDTFCSTIAFCQPQFGTCD